MLRVEVDPKRKHAYCQLDADREVRVKLIGPDAFAFEIASRKGDINKPAVGHAVQDDFRLSIFYASKEAMEAMVACMYELSKLEADADSLESI